MFTRLEKTYEPLRAQITAGVLRTHGIDAWVTGDVSSSNYGTIASGGCSLMVEEEDIEEARQILEAHPQPVDDTGSEGESAAPRSPLSFWSSLGNGTLHGAVWLPLLTLAFYMIVRFIAALRRAKMTMWGEDFPVFARGFFRGIVLLGVTGAVVGLIAGLAAWLLSSYRHRGKVGIAFVVFIALLMTGPQWLLVLWAL